MDIGHRTCTHKQRRKKQDSPRDNVGRQSDPNMKCTLVHVGPTMGGALTDREGLRCWHRGTVVTLNEACVVG